jgi:chitinase
MRRTNFIARQAVCAFTLGLIFFICFTGARAQSVTVQYATNSDYGNGFTGQITINNSTTQAINGWTLAFDFDRTINSIWDAVLSKSGNRYTIKNTSFNSVIPAGGSVSFDFTGSPVNVYTGDSGGTAPAYQYRCVY